MYLTARLIDANTGKPVPFATIVLKNSELGVISNAEGNFRIKKSPNLLSDSLIVTCIGYDKKIMSVKKLKTDVETVIQLNPSNIFINEIQVKSKFKKIHSKDLVRRALKRINMNYPSKPFDYVAYYRDYQKRNNNYINLNEAIIYSEDNGFNTSYGLTNHRLLDYLENNTFNRINIPEYYSDGISQNSGNKLIPGAFLPDHGGNELFILNAHDAIRRYNEFSFSFIETLAEDFIKKHNFKDIEVVYNNDLPLYSIDFESLRWKTPDTIFALGTIFLEPENLAIHRIDYSCFYIKDDGRTKPMFSVQLEYGHNPTVDSLMNLKYISFNNMFQVIDENDTTCFILEKQIFFDLESKLVLKFNHEVDIKSALKKSNYDVVLGNKKAKIKDINVENDQVIIFLKKSNSNLNGANFSLRELKDINGRIVNEKREMEVFQYRELFVQEYNPKIKLEGDCYLQNLPLSKNCITKMSGEKKYWMNTPVEE